MKWCKKYGYKFSQEKALELHAKACSCVGVMPSNHTTKLLVQQAIVQLQATSAALASLKPEMQSLAASLPEYPVVMGMFGVGPVLGPQLMLKLVMCVGPTPRRLWLLLTVLTLLLTNLAKPISAAAVFPSVVQLLCVKLCFL